MPGFLLAQSSNYILNGKVGQLSSPAKAYLRYERQVDSAVIINGEFRLTGAVTKAYYATLIMNDKGTGYEAGIQTQIFLEPATMSLVITDSFTKVKVTGSPLNDDNNRLRLKLAPVYEKMGAVSNEYIAASAEKKKSKQFLDYINKSNESLTKQMKAIYLNFIKENPNSLYSLYALRSIESSVPDSIAVIESIFNSLSQKVKSTSLGIDYVSAIEQMKNPLTDIRNIGLANGILAPNFTQFDTAGKSILLSDYKGKYVLVDFWASWCGPCRAENPNVLKAYNNYKDKGLNILGVSLDDSKSKWIKAINDDKLPWTQVSDLKGWDNVAAVLYLVKGIPQNYLVGPDGKIVAKNLRGEDLENKLAELLK